MVALILAALVAWIRNGNSIIHENWTAEQHGNPAGMLRQIFNGVCLGMLGMTGFECMQFDSWLRGVILTG